MRNQQPFGNTDPTYKDSGQVREGRRLNLTLIEYAILGIDGQLLFVRKYPPIKPKDMPKCMMPLEDYKWQQKHKKKDAE